jgi:hypothetical protein
MIHQKEASLRKHFEYWKNVHIEQHVSTHDVLLCVGQYYLLKVIGSKNLICLL